MGSLEQPVWKVGDICLHYFEHTSIRDIGSIGRDEVLVTRLDLEEVTERRLQADVVEGSDFLPVGHFSCVQNRPLGELCYAVGSFLVL